MLDIAKTRVLISGQGSIGQHPVIVLTPPNPDGFVFVTPMSHNHPEGTPTRCASTYGLPVDPVKGESRVNVGQPKLIHLSNLRANNPHTTMSMKHYKRLWDEICELSSSLRIFEGLRIY